MIYKYINFGTLIQTPPRVRSCNSPNASWKVLKTFCTHWHKWVDPEMFPFINTFINEDLEESQRSVPKWEGAGRQHLRYSSL